MVGATKCETCPAKILAIVPMVPIVPNLIQDVHTQWKSYNGFTFAFKDYIDADITQYIDSDAFALAMNITDPFAYFEKMTDIPKFFVVSSDDEFMSMEWTNSYYDKIPGEKHLLIVPNSEHSLTTGFYDIYSSLGTFVRSIAHGIKKRPTFEYFVNRETGEISVTIPTDQVQPT
jgi:PhoPQ-activated pathogenicity-related protein